MSIQLSLGVQDPEQPLLPPGGPRKCLERAVMRVTSCHSKFKVLVLLFSPGRHGKRMSIAQTAALDASTAWARKKKVPTRNKYQVRKMEYQFVALSDALKHGRIVSIIP